MSEEKVLEILCDFANALEAACVSVRQRIVELIGVKEAFAADFDKLFWEKKEGVKGPYEQTSKRATNNSDIFKALQAKLRERNGFWQHQGFKYWFDRQDQDVIDRRKS